MGAPTVFRWDDTDAPVLSGTAGSLVALLDACLVNGYGTKAALGWATVFTALNKRVYRNESVVGVGGFFRFDDTATDGNEHICHVVLYESMADIDTGAGPTPTTGSGYISKSAANNSAVARPWVLVGDDRCFYLYVAVNNTTGVVGVGDYQFIHLSFLGDLIPDDPADTFCCGMIVPTAISAYYGAYLANSSNLSKHIMRLKDGSLGAVQPALKSANDIAGSILGSTGFVYPLNGKTVYAKPYLDDVTTGTLRGWLPGLYYPVHQYPLDTFSQDDLGDGRVLMALNFSSYASHAQVCLDIGVGFRP